MLEKTNHPDFEFSQVGRLNVSTHLKTMIRSSVKMGENLSPPKIWGVKIPPKKYVI